jgi:hypothetical protein
MDAKVKLQKEYEKLIKSNWKFLNNEYNHVEKKNYHRTELQEIKLIDDMKDEIYNKLGELPMFIFITDFCNNFNIPGPYNDIDKAVVIVYHLIIGVSINQMETYLNYTNFFRMYKYIFITKYDELNNWINNILYNCSSNKNIRLLSSYINNPELVKHVTLILDGHHNKIIYENVTVDQKTLYSWKLKSPGLNTQFIIDTNDIVVFISDSLPCKDNNDDKMLINNINFNKFFSIYDNLCFDGLYINTLHETIAKFSLRNLELEESNFTFPINKKKKIKLQEDEDKLNRYIGGFRSKIESYFANLGKKFNRFDAKNKIRVTKLETYNIQLRFCCALFNIKKIVDITRLDMLPKYSKWMEKEFDYPDKNNITCKSTTVLFKFNNMNIMKNRQLDTLSALLNNIDIDEKIELINENNMIDNESQQSYEVQYIFKHKTNDNGEKEYLVKWKGYSKKHNSWVKEKDFVERDIINSYTKDIMDEDF